MTELIELESGGGLPRFDPAGISPAMHAWLLDSLRRSLAEAERQVEAATAGVATARADLKSAQRMHRANVRATGIVSGPNRLQATKDSVATQADVSAAFRAYKAAKEQYAGATTWRRTLRNWTARAESGPKQAQAVMLQAWEAKTLLIGSARPAPKTMRDNLKDPRRHGTDVYAVRGGLIGDIHAFATSAERRAARRRARQAGQEAGE